MPAYNCKHPTCSRLLPRPGYCPKHEQQGQAVARERVRIYDKTQRHNKALYNSKGWQIVRRQVLDAEPLCRKCRKEFARDVDHIIPVDDCEARGIDPLDIDNLQPLCRRCHNAKTGEERRRKGGEWN